MGEFKIGNSSLPSYHMVTKDCPLVQGSTFTEDSQYYQDAEDSILNINDTIQLATETMTRLVPIHEYRDDTYKMVILAGVYKDYTNTWYTNKIATQEYFTPVHKSYIIHHYTDDTKS